MNTKYILSIFIIFTLLMTCCGASFASDAVDDPSHDFNLDDDLNLDDSGDDSSDDSDDLDDEGLDDDSDDWDDEGLDDDSDDWDDEGLDDDSDDLDDEGLDDDSDDLDDEGLDDDSDDWDVDDSDDWDDEGLDDDSDDWDDEGLDDLDKNFNIDDIRARLIEYDKPVPVPSYADCILKDHEYYVKNAVKYAIPKTYAAASSINYINNKSNDKIEDILSNTSLNNEKIADNLEKSSVSKSIHTKDYHMNAEDNNMPVIYSSIASDNPVIDSGNIKSINNQEANNQTMISIDFNKILALLVSVLLSIILII